MILVDANLLIYAHVKDFAEHPAARQWLDEQINTQPRVGFAWSSLLAFMRITSNPRIFERPLSVEKAWAQVQSWLSAAATWTPTPGAKHADVLASLISDITRPVPNALFLRPLIEALLAADMPAAEITVLVATGLHRPNEGAELAELVGDPWVLETVRVENHFARKADWNADWTTRTISREGVQPRSSRTVTRRFWARAAALRPEATG